MARGHVGVDDYALTRVPMSERYSWIQVAVQRFGQISALSQFLLGATIGFGMSFWDAFIAFTLGAVILEIVAILVGVIGVREGLQTSMVVCASVRVRLDGVGSDHTRRVFMDLRRS